MFMRLILLGGAMAAAALAAETNREAAFLSQARQLTFEGKRSGEGYFAADGAALIFQSEREAENPFYQIYTLDLETGDTRRVSPGQGKTTCGFFRPGSDELLFASTHLDPQSVAKQREEFAFRASGRQKRYSWDYDAEMDIFSARRDGTAVRRLTTTPGYDAEGAWSPDGSKIVFCSLRAAYPTNQLSAADLKRLETDPAHFGDIYIMNADGSGQQRLTHSPGYDGGPFFSPDGGRIVWRRFDTNGVVADVFTMKIDGTDERRLTDFQCMSWAPFFHPSGAYVIFTANKLGFSNFELFIVDARGEREPMRVTYTDGFDGLPSFSPDGGRLTWTSARGADGKSQIHLAQWNHAAALAALQLAPARAAAGAVALPVASALARLSNDVAVLAAPGMEGRMTGSAGARRASQFIADELARAGLAPAGTNGGFFQPFDFNAGVRLLTNDNRLVVAPAGAPPTVFTPEKHFRPLAFTDSGSVTGEVVFAGYGLAVPGKPGEGYDSYAGLDVSNRIVLLLRYVPEAVEPKRRQELNRYAGLRYKAMLARERGARAVLVVSGPSSPAPGDLVGLSSDAASGGSGIMAVSVSTNVVAAMFGAVGRDLKTVQAALDVENPHAEGGFVFSNLTVSLTTAVEHVRQSDRNVLALLPGAGALSNEVVIVGAHYDHLGYGESGAMLRAGEENKIHHGADDNASGTANVLELARAVAAKHAKSPDTSRRSILFALWSGEEMGLLGSTHYTTAPIGPLTNVAACFNFDMVGRLRDNKLMLQGLGSSTAWRRLIEKHNVAAGFQLVLQDDPYLPTDVTAFYPRGVPVISFFTGSHDDYHRPTDTPEKINLDGLERILKFSRGLLLDVAGAATRPDYVKVATSQQGGSRDNLRAYLGTIPDYATEVQGVKISGVRGGSPAEKAGLLGGDVIVEFAGQKIANIYDYTYALDAVKIGQPITIVVQRAGQKVTVTATPEARK